MLRDCRPIVGNTELCRPWKAANPLEMNTTDVLRSMVFFITFLSA